MIQAAHAASTVTPRAMAADSAPTIRLAVDLMGGDHGPAVTLPACRAFLAAHHGAELVLVGRDDALAQAAGWPRCTRVAASEVVEMTDSVETALRRKKDSSLRVAVSQVKAHTDRASLAQACVSAGNTGALMAMARLVLTTMPGIERPAIAGQWPTLSGSCIVLDLGANVGATARQLADFALMGAAMARAVLQIERPRVGLLNIGVEEIKGVEEVRQAHAWLKENDLPIDYRGFIEGDQIGQGVVDVVVVEGFAGNIALKTAEGTAKQMAAWVREALSSSVAAKLGALLAESGLRALKDRMDPRRFNGGPFLGLNGIAIKSHGGIDAFGFAQAIEVGYDMAKSNVLERLAADLEALHGKLGEPERARGSS